MTKSKIFVLVAALLAFVSVFGAWTDADSGELRYADAPLLSTYANETISFTRREVSDENYTDGNCPYYYPLADLPNSCGAVAGAEIVAFYDKYFTELIPDWTPYYTSNANYRRQDTTYVPALMRDLYAKMRTNVDDVGVSEGDFLNGLTSYINGKGRQVSYQSVKSGNTLNYEQCKNAINNNKVIVLFTAPTTVYSVGLGTNTDSITETKIAGAHILVIYGYVQVKYYNNSGLFRTDTYLEVAMGQTGYTYKYYRPGSTTTRAAYIVNVQ